jgi:hypothetical protein
MRKSANRLKEHVLLERVLEQSLHHRRKQLGKGRPHLRTTR